MKITLIQPKYPHGDKSQTYLPGGLMNLGSRLLHAGIEINFIDLNDGYWKKWQQILDESDLIGFTVIGPPSIPEVIKTIHDMREAGLKQTVFVGGEGVSRLQPNHFKIWFSDLNVFQIRGDQDLALICKVNIQELPDAFDTSMVSMLKTLDEEQLRKYLTSEFSLFTSQGCAFNCAFCAADKAKKEHYRSLESLADELKFICQYLKQIKCSELRSYLTNLDAFQTPHMLEKRDNTQFPWLLTTCF